MKPITSEGYSSRFPSGKKYIAYNSDTKMYLHESCTTETPDRNYAWVGTLFQANNMLEAYPFARSFKIMKDGTEKKV